MYNRLYEPKAERGPMAKHRGPCLPCVFFSLHTLRSTIQIAFNSRLSPYLSFVRSNKSVHPHIQKKSVPFQRESSNHVSNYMRTKNATAAPAKNVPAATREAPAVGMGVGAPVGLLLLPAGVLTMVVGTPAG